MQKCVSGQCDQSLGVHQALSQSNAVVTELQGRQKKSDGLREVRSSGALHHTALGGAQPYQAQAAGGQRGAHPRHGAVAQALADHGAT